MPYLQSIRANFDQNTITVYQAYNKHIALPAIQHNRFSPPFSFQRMTWIKPSYLWMMARSGWATKSNQEYILAIKMSRKGWEKALSYGVLTHPDEKVYKTGEDWRKAMDGAKVNIQWDPERTLRGAKLDHRAIQVGISRHLIEEYNNSWIQEITDYTPLTKKINQLRKQGNYKAAKRLLPKERLYEVSENISKRIGVY